MPELDEIISHARSAAGELCEKAKLTPGQTVIVGCSTSEISGRTVGTAGNPVLGAAVFNALYSVFSAKGILLAAQCCEHLNRAVIVEREAAAGFQIVNAVPRPDAGGAFAAAAWTAFKNPAAVEEFFADAGLDIGGTLIGMHLKRVAIPLRLETPRIGNALLIAARTRPKLIGGVRAGYDERLL